MSGNIQGYYLPFEKTICIREDAINPAATLVHETVHSILHGNSNETTPQIMEIEAEAATYCVLKRFGIDNPSQFYLAAWGANKHNVIASLRRIQETASMIIGALKKRYPVNVEKISDVA